MEEENSFIGDIGYYPATETLNFRVTEYWGGCGDEYISIPVAALTDEQVADEWKKEYMKENA